MAVETGWGAATGLAMRGVAPAACPLLSVSEGGRQLKDLPPPAGKSGMWVPLGYPIRTPERLTFTPGVCSGQANSCTELL